VGNANNSIESNVREKARAFFAFENRFVREALESLLSCVWLMVLVSSSGLVVYIDVMKTSTLVSSKS
jgi:hypothetical protein